MAKKRNGTHGWVGDGQILIQLISCEVNRLSSGGEFRFVRANCECKQVATGCEKNKNKTETVLIKLAVEKV